MTTDWTHQIRGLDTQRFSELTRGVETSTAERRPRIVRLARGRYMLKETALAR